MTDKPVITLRTTDREQAPAIHKYLTQNAVEGTFRDLVGYMCETRGDEYNEALDSPDERNLSATVLDWLNANRDTTRLHYRDSSNNYPYIDLDERVGDNLDRIIQRDRKETAEGVREFDHAELIYRQEEVGGKK